MCMHALRALFEQSSHSGDSVTGNVICTQKPSSIYIYIFCYTAAAPSTHFILILVLLAVVEV